LIYIAHRRETSNALMMVSIMTYEPEDIHRRQDGIKHLKQAQ